MTLVVPYDISWPIMFNHEAKELNLSIGDPIVEINHIGSTAVPGLMAKPIIDILIEVKDLNTLDNLAKNFENLRYEVMGEYGIPGRRYYRKGGRKRTHHIHAFASGDDNLMRHLAFRDYLRAHPKVSDEYGKLKVEIANRNDAYDNYWQAKGPFIKHHEALAIAWYKNIHFSNT